MKAKIALLALWLATSLPYAHAETGEGERIWMRVSRQHCTARTISTAFMR